MKQLFFPLLLPLLLTISACANITQPIRFSLLHKTGDTYMGIVLRGTIQLAEQTIDEIKVNELSGLAWDEDEQLLYAISDNGFLFHLRPILAKQTLIDAHILAAFPLTNQGKRLSSRDSEGLSLLKGDNQVTGDSELIISFERKPRIARFTPTGKLKAEYQLPQSLSQPASYQTPNQGLEAVTLHPQWGILTAPEKPLIGNNPAEIIIYNLHNQQWQLPRHPAPNSAVVALEALADGSIMILERAFVSMWQPFIISLRHLSSLADSTQKQPAAEVELIAEFNNLHGWQIDNFEGLTHHKDNYFFMVSDDNERQLQRSLLSYFEMAF